VDNLSFSNLIAVRSPTPGLAAARLNGTCLGSPHERPFESWQQGLFGVRDALVSTVPGYFPAYAYGARRYCDSMFPATPYGFVRMVPDCPEAESLLTGRYVLRTDGIAELIHGARIGADAARSRLQHDLERGLDGQWFLAAGVGVYAHRVGNAYRVWLMDPGYLCPEGVRTVLQVRLPEPSLSVRDLISGQPITGVTADGCAGRWVPPPRGRPWSKAVTPARTGSRAGWRAGGYSRRRPGVRPPSTACQKSAFSRR
jgi:hypothetical protein